MTAAIITIGEAPAGLSAPVLSGLVSHRLTADDVTTLVEYIGEKLPSYLHEDYHDAARMTTGDLAEFQLALDTTFRHNSLTPMFQELIELLLQHGRIHLATDGNLAESMADALRDAIAENDLMETQ